MWVFCAPTGARVKRPASRVPHQRLRWVGMVRMVPGGNGDQVAVRDAGGHCGGLVLRDVALRAAAAQQRRRSDRTQAIPGGRVAPVDLVHDGGHQRQSKSSGPAGRSGMARSRGNGGGASQRPAVQPVRPRQACLLIAAQLATGTSRSAARGVPLTVTGWWPGNPPRADGDPALGPAAGEGRRPDAKVGPHVQLDLFGQP